MKLCDLHKRLSNDEWEALAEKAGANPRYLWQCATRWRGARCSLRMIERLVRADKRLKLKDLAEEFTTEPTS